MHSVQEVMESMNMVIFGASRNPMKPGATVLLALKNTGFKGQIAGINPQGGEVHGIKLYQSLDEVPFSAELALFLIPPKLIPGVLTDCARRGVKGVVISSEGFAETGLEGKQYQEEIQTILRSTGMRGFGPNTLGIINTATGMSTSQVTSESVMKPGSIGFISQSGIFVGALLHYICSLEGLNLSKGLGLGNKVDVDESDALEYLRDDDQTRIVGMYLEDIRDGQRFLATAREVVKKKPVLLLKGGRTPAGAKAAASHTASLAVNDSVLDGALRQAGVIRLKGIDELIATLKGFSFMPLPRGDRIAFVTFSGAQAIMSTDAAMEEGLELARFTEETRERVGQVIATPSKAQNPVDIYPDMMAHGFEKTNKEILSALLDDEGVHGIVYIAAPFLDDTFHPLLDVIKSRLNKPVFFSLLGTKETVDPAQLFLEKNRFPTFSFPEKAVHVFAHMLRYARTIGEA